MDVGSLLTRPRFAQAFRSLLELSKKRDSHPEFCIPVCMVPATISNNVPGTDLSIDCDTGLNVIVEVRSSHLLKEMARQGSRRVCLSHSRRIGTGTCWIFQGEGSLLLISSG